MNMKINTICFVLFLFLLVGVVSASEDTNETLQTIEQPDVVKISVNSSDGFLEKSLASDPPLQASQKSTSSASKSKVTLKASDVKMYYGDGSKFKITLKDNKKKAMKNTKLKIVINDKTYHKSTNSEGVISINLNFDSGKYKVTTTYEGSSKYAKKSISNTITIKSTISANDFSKYYKNTNSYTAKFYDTKGKVLKKTKVKYQFDKKVSSAKTNSKGELSIKLSGKPGTHTLYLINPKSNELDTRKITIKPTIEHLSFEMDRNAFVKYSVKVLDSNGKAVKNKKVVFKINKNEYKKYSDSNGVATYSQTFAVGTHTITTKYDSQEMNYQFEVYQGNPSNQNTQQNNNQNIPIQQTTKNTKFSHKISIPNSVNVTNDIVFHDSAYVEKLGIDGIIKMPKKEYVTIQINETTAYTFSNTYIEGVSSYLFGYYTYLVPFDGSPIQKQFKKENLVGDGILIYNENGYNHIEFRGTAESDVDLFGVYLSKGLDYTETITYVQNTKIKAMVNFYTYAYDELGVRYNLAKFYGVTIYDFDYKTYEQITHNNTKSIRYTQTNEPVKFSYFGKTIIGQLSSENIMTRFYVDGVEQLEKPETISYGQSPDYKNSMGFEVLQSYAILNDKVSEEKLEQWLSKNESYLSRVAISNLYGMFISALETAWLVDELADQNAVVCNVSWQRDMPSVVMAGINLNNTYLHILNADMGMNVTGLNENVTFFKLINSFYLTDVENYALSVIAESYGENSTNSIDEVISAIGNGEFSIVQVNESVYIFTENGQHSAVVINTTSGVSNVISVVDGVAYKGAVVNTACDCCSVSATPTRIIHHTYRTINTYKSNGKRILDLFNDAWNFAKNNFARLGVLGYFLVSGSLKLLNAAFPNSLSVAALGMVSSMLTVHSVSKYVREEFFDEKDWYSCYDYFTPSRNTPIENKKVFNIPKSNGKYDYVEVEIKKDGSLNRKNAVLISEGNYKKLSESETYKYFKEDNWVPWTVPKKYQPYPIPL